MVALVTGHRGYLGSHAVRALIAAGWSVTGVGRPETEIPSDAFEKILEEVAADVVVHCSGPASVPAAERDPVSDRRGSVEVLSALLGSLIRAKAGTRLVLVSSAAVYGDPIRLPVTEQEPLRPISAYGTHRLECEQLAIASNVPTAVARVFSAYGEGLRRQVLWDITQSALRGDRVELQGTGRESRDFVHGADVGQALATIAHLGSFVGESYNVGTGVETTIAELAHKLVTAVNPRAQVGFSGRNRAGDPLRWRADISAAQALGFSPMVTIDEGAARYAAWARSSE